MATFTLPKNSKITGKSQSYGSASGGKVKKFKLREQANALGSL